MADECDLVERATATVAKWEHGDEQHRQWLRDTAIPDVLAMLQEDAAEITRLRAECEDMTAAASALSGDVTALASALRTHTPYGEMCRDPLTCHATGRCVRDPVCGE